VHALPKAETPEVLYERKQEVPPAIASAIAHDVASVMESRCP
jgi:hypothetical protein